MLDNFSWDNFQWQIHLFLPAYGIVQVEVGDVGAHAFFIFGRENTVEDEFDCCEI